MTASEARRFSRATVMTLALLSGSGGAIAQESGDALPAGADVPAPVLDKASGEDRFALSIVPYLWATSFSGTLSVRGVQADVEETFLDIVDSSDTVYGFMGAIDLRADRLVFQLNSTWTAAEFSDQRAVLESGTATGDLDVEIAWIELFGGYRVYQAPLSEKPQVGSGLAVDVFGGGRHTRIEADYDLSAATTVTLPGGGVLTPGRSETVSGSDEWLEPFVGARLSVDLSEHWSIALRGDVGGFGVDDSEFSWHTMGLAGYRWRLDGWDIELFGGYRALGQELDSESFAWDVVTHGVIAGAQARFSF